MENIHVNKELLRSYETLLVVLENCDIYEIAVEDILDIYCVAKPIGKKKNQYYTNDGFVKIVARASQTIEYLVSRNHEIGTQWDYRLKERLEMCGICADMTSFSLRDNKKSDIDIYVPYNPLESIVRGGEIELSNCPSLEIDNDGNIIISFGERSKQPKRIDNNYAELIDGWKDAFGDFEPKVLKAKAVSWSSFGNSQTNFSFSFKVCNKNSKKDFVELVFLDCKDLSFEMFFTNKRNCEILMSKMADGHIYVGFDGLGIDFICSSIQEYDYYCTQEDVGCL